MFVSWLRSFLRHLASEGRTVLVSSHVLSEVEQTVDDVVIIARGHLVRACPLTDLTEASHGVVVRSPEIAQLTAALTAAPGVTVVPQSDGSVIVHGAEPAAVGRAALTAQVELHELRTSTSDLEQVFLSLTGGATS